MQVMFKILKIPYQIKNKIAQNALFDEKGEHNEIKRNFTFCEYNFDAYT